MSSNNNSINKWALLIGINQYTNLAPRYQLHGCVNDVVLMAGILQKNFGFPQSHITMLLNSTATRDGILAALHTLADRVAKDDMLVLVYSGHGSQMTDREGDEPDGFDETIVPYDSGRGSYENRDITDDEIYAWLLQVTQQTPYVTLLFDCCHSGTISRDLFGTASRWVEPDTRRVVELPPSPVSSEITRALTNEMAGPSGWLPLGKRYVLIAGCSDEESSYEYQTRQEKETITHGTLTYFLSQELVKASPGTSYRDLFERASILVTANQPRQHPQMEGARDRELFGIQDIDPIRFVTVKARRGEQVNLAAGAAHGLTIGSQWAIYPQSTKQVDEQTRKLGLVEITSVHAVTSEARIIEELQQDAITIGYRAVEHSHSYGEMRLAVQVKAPAGYETQTAALAELLEKSNLLHQVEASEPAEARAYIIPARDKVAKRDPVPQLGAVSEPVWAVVGLDGRLMMPVHPVSEAGVAAVLRDNLEKIARYRQGLALRNANDTDPLQGKVDFILKRQAVDHSWVVAEPEEASGLIVFEAGDRIGAEIINHHTKPIYVSILNFGLTNKIGLLHPIVGASEPLAPGQFIEIGIREGDNIDLYMPETFPYVLDPTDKNPVGGTETYKLFATLHEADFSYLVQEGVRDAGLTRGWDKPLLKLFTRAMTGLGATFKQWIRPAPEEAWTTVERSFFLRRRVL